MRFVFRLTARFQKAIAGILSEDDLIALEMFLITHPEAGDVIQGGKGLRKVRFAAKGHGKRGGARVIYLRVVSSSLIVLADFYPKNAKADLSHSELQQLLKEIEE